MKLSIGKTLAALVLACAALGLGVGAQAAPVTNLLYATEADDLRLIGFDGSGFTSGFATVLESGFSPAWTGISYDPGAELLYFSTASNDLRVIGFDGSGFTSGFATVLESGFSPGWTGISYDPAAELLYFSTMANDLRVIGFDGSGFTSGFATIIESGFSPSWAGISIITETPFMVVPTPAALSLIALPLLLLVIVSHRLGARRSMNESTRAVRRCAA